MEEETATILSLSSPLLSTTNCVSSNTNNISGQLGAMSIEWPKYEAERVKLYIPQDYDPYQDERNPGKCFLSLDIERNILAVIVEATGETLDIIDPNDIIGVKVDIELSTGGEGTPIVVDGSATELQVISSRGTTNAQETQRLVDDNSGTQQRPFRQTNEPASDTPIDRQAGAVLSLYVYPKRDLSKDSIISSCFARKKPKPNLIYPPQASSTSAQAEAPADQQSTKYGHRYQHHRRFSIVPVEDFSDLSTMVKAIQLLASPKPCGVDSPPSNDKRRLLVIVNPLSGLKKAQEIYAMTLRPMLEEAGVEHDCVVTKYAGHGMELMKERSSTGGDEILTLQEYAAVVCVGGDGLVHEIMQGIHGRSDKKEIFKAVKLGIVGAGTSNGLAATLAHASEEKCSPLDSCFAVAKGNCSWLDLSEYQTISKSYTSFLTFSWSIIAEIDIESECIRFMGFLRMDLWGVWRTICLRRYRARFSYLPPTQDKRMVELPPLNEPLPENDGWITEEDTFILFWASHVSHAGEAMFHTPHSKIDDGVFTIFIVRGHVSRLRLALILIEMSHGGHVDMHGVEFVQCSAYRLEPITPGSFNDLDGEVIESGPVQAAVMPASIQAYCNL